MKTPTPHEAWNTLIERIGHAIDALNARRCVQRRADTTPHELPPEAWAARIREREDAARDREDAVRHALRALLDACTDHPDETVRLTVSSADGATLHHVPSADAWASDEIGGAALNPERWLHLFEAHAPGGVGSSSTQDAHRLVIDNARGGNESAIVRAVLVVETCEGVALLDPRDEAELIDHIRTLPADWAARPVRNTIARAARYCATQEPPRAEEGAIDALVDLGLASPVDGRTRP